MNTKVPWLPWCLRFAFSQYQYSFHDLQSKTEHLIISSCSFDDYFIFLLRFDMYQCISYDSPSQSLTQLHTLNRFPTGPMKYPVCSHATGRWRSTRLTVATLRGRRWRSSCCGTFSLSSREKSVFFRCQFSFACFRRRGTTSMEDGPTKNV